MRIFALLLSLFFVLSFGSKITLEDAITGNNQFAFDFYKQTLAPKDQNTFASAFSISSAFAMTYAGAVGKAKDELAQTFYFSKTPDFHTKQAEFQNTLQSNLPTGLALEVANALWINKDFKFLPAYEAIVREQYKAKLEKVDFKNAQKACDLINDWTSEKTHSKIQKIVEPSMITPELRLVLTNAIYFKSIWKIQFDKPQTRTLPFQLTSEKSEQVPFMHGQARYKYMENTLLQMVELPYKDDALSMHLLLPQTGKTIQDLEKNLAYTDYLKWQEVMQANADVWLYLPKFKIESSFMLNENLQDMGLKAVFQAGAGFTHVIENTPLHISQVLHKSFVEVNEEGTEAAAVTAILMATETSDTSTHTPKYRIFNANRPFIFLIKDNKTGAILFMGKVMNPKTT